MGAVPERIWSRLLAICPVLDDVNVSAFVQLAVKF